MKKPNLALSLVFAIAFVSAAVGQTAKFDVVTYLAPAGYTVEKDAGSMRFTKDANSNYCVISLTRSVDASADSSKNFEALWQAMAVEGLNATASPQRGKAGSKNGWEAEVGVGVFEKDGLKGAALLTTFTGNGKVVAVLAITNSDAYQPDIEKFVDNITLPAIAAQKASVAAPAAAASGDTSKLIGRWQRSSSSSPSYADAASWGNAGYTKCRYEFNADGTYIYTERSFRYSYQNIIVVRENGRYTLNGSTLTVSPARSTIAAYRKAGGVDALGPVVSTQNRKLETVAYKLTFHYFSGIQEWNLVLQADTPTQRDGQFSTLTVFNNAWYFDQKFTGGDLSAVRVN
ncbi:MAG: hypothetical protein ABIR33_06110 [Pyrinomonadaceae bacterium]